MSEPRVRWWQAQVAARLPLFRNEEAADRYTSMCSRMALDAQPHAGLSPSTDILMEAIAYGSAAELDHQIALNAAVEGMDEWIDMAAVGDVLKQVTAGQRALVASRRSTSNSEVDREVERQMRQRMPSLMEAIVESVRFVIADKALADELLHDMYRRVTAESGTPD